MLHKSLQCMLMDKYRHSGLSKCHHFDRLMRKQLKEMFPGYREEDKKILL